eukprot:Lithocolla_globosa_v1_NODE_880_length_3143_cov_5.921632.p2 type:complete len:210 gc:universal NODE_880_length_3143_cov_5.921632:1035-406(-)
MFIITMRMPTTATKKPMMVKYTEICLRSNCMFESLLTEEISLIVFPKKVLGPVRMTIASHSPRVTTAPPSNSSPTSLDAGMDSPVRAASSRASSCPFFSNTMTSAGTEFPSTRRIRSRGTSSLTGTSFTWLPRLTVQRGEARSSNTLIAVLVLLELRRSTITTATNSNKSIEKVRKLRSLAEGSQTLPCGKTTAETAATTMKKFMMVKE